MLAVNEVLDVGQLLLILSIEMYFRSFSIKLFSLEFKSRADASLLFLDGEHQ